MKARFAALIACVGFMIMDFSALAETSPENTADACKNGTDDDSDGFTDCDDQDCSALFVFCIEKEEEGHQPPAEEETHLPPVDAEEEQGDESEEPENGNEEFQDEEEEFEDEELEEDDEIEVKDCEEDSDCDDTEVCLSGECSARTVMFDTPVKAGAPKKVAGKGLFISGEILLDISFVLMASLFVFADVPVTAGMTIAADIGSMMMLGSMLLAMKQLKDGGATPSGGVKGLLTIGWILTGATIPFLGYSFYASGRVSHYENLREREDSDTWKAYEYLKLKNKFRKLTYMGYGVSLGLVALTLVMTAIGRSVVTKQVHKDLANKSAFQDGAGVCIVPSVWSDAGTLGFGLAGTF